MAEDSTLHQVKHVVDCQRDLAETSYVFER
jgi:hypothetical protein